jgi:hypothetical protein
VRGKTKRGLGKVFQTWFFQGFLQQTKALGSKQQTYANKMQNNKGQHNTYISA